MLRTSSERKTEAPNLFDPLMIRSSGVGDKLVATMEVTLITLYKGYNVLAS